MPRDEPCFTAYNTLLSSYSFLCSLAIPLALSLSHSLAHSTDSFFLLVVLPSLSPFLVSVHYQFFVLHKTSIFASPLIVYLFCYTRRATKRKSETKRNELQRKEKQIRKIGDNCLVCQPSNSPSAWQQANYSCSH